MTILIFCFIALASAATYLPELKPAQFQYTLTFPGLDGITKTADMFPLILGDCSMCKTEASCSRCVKAAANGDNSCIQIGPNEAGATAIQLVGVSFEARDIPNEDIGWIFYPDSPTCNEKVEASAQSSPVKNSQTTNQSGTGANSPEVGGLENIPLTSSLRGSNLQSNSAPGTNPLAGSLQGGPNNPAETNQLSNSAPVINPQSNSVLGTNQVSNSGQIPNRQVSTSWRRREKVRPGSQSVEIPLSQAQARMSFSKGIPQYSSFRLFVNTAQVKGSRRFSPKEINHSVPPEGVNDFSKVGTATDWKVGNFFQPETRQFISSAGPERNTPPEDPPNNEDLSLNLLRTPTKDTPTGGDIANFYNNEGRTIFRKPGSIWQMQKHEFPDENQQVQRNKDVQGNGQINIEGMEQSQRPESIRDTVQNQGTEEIRTTNQPSPERSKSRPIVRPLDIFQSQQRKNQLADDDNDDAYSVEAIGSDDSLDGFRAYPKDFYDIYDPRSFLDITLPVIELHEISYIDLDQAPSSELAAFAEAFLPEPDKSQRMWRFPWPDPGLIRELETRGIVLPEELTTINPEGNTFRDAIKLAGGYYDAIRDWLASLPKEERDGILREPAQLTDAQKKVLNWLRVIFPKTLQAMSVSPNRPAEEQPMVRPSNRLANPKTMPGQATTGISQEQRPERQAQREIVVEEEEEKNQNEEGQRRETRLTNTVEEDDESIGFNPLETSMTSTTSINFDQLLGPRRTNSQLNRSLRDESLPYYQDLLRKTAQIEQTDDLATILRKMNQVQTPNRDRFHEAMVGVRHNDPDRMNIYKRPGDDSVLKDLNLDETQMGSRFNSR